MGEGDTSSVTSSGTSSADWLSTVSTLLKVAGGAQSTRPTGPTPAGPSSAYQSNSNMFNNSGWTASTGSSSASSSNIQFWAVTALIAFGMLVLLKLTQKK